MAELHRPGGERQHRVARGPQPVHASDRSDLCDVRRPSRTRIRRRTQLQPTALLHQLCLTRPRSRRGSVNTLLMEPLLRRMTTAGALVFVLAFAWQVGSGTEPGSKPTANDDLRSPRAAPPQAATATSRPPATISATSRRIHRAAKPPRSRLQNPSPRSRSIGTPTAGRLLHGVTLRAFGPDHATWHPIRKTQPNASWRRNATGRLVRLVLRIAREHRRANPGAPRLLVGDLSRPRGGDFGASISGGLGHASHQNGLDVDIYYPRKDRRLRAPDNVSDVDQVLAQDLVDRFVAAGAQYVFTGPHLRLRGPSRIVQDLPHHDNHLHVRLPAEGPRK
jgi:hypothetical protein